MSVIALDRFPGSLIGFFPAAARQKVDRKLNVDTADLGWACVIADMRCVFSNLSPTARSRKKKASGRILMSEPFPLLYSSLPPDFVGGTPCRILSSA